MPIADQRKPDWALRVLADWGAGNREAGIGLRVLTGWMSLAAP